MKRLEIIFALSLLLVSGFLLGETFHFPKAFRSVEPGAALFPRLLTIFILASTAFYLVQIFRSQEAPKPEAAQMNLVFSISLVTLGYISLIPSLGYFLATPVFLVLVLFLLNQRKCLPFIFLPLLMTMFSYFIFYKLLNIQLPLGLLRYFR